MQRFQCGCCTTRSSTVESVDCNKLRMVAENTSCGHFSLTVCCRAAHLAHNAYPWTTTCERLLKRRNELGASGHHRVNTNHGYFTGSSRPAADSLCCELCRTIQIREHEGQIRIRRKRDGGSKNDNRNLLR